MRTIEVDIDGGTVEPISKDEFEHSEVALVLPMQQLQELALDFASLALTPGVLRALPTSIVMLGSDVMELAAKFIRAVKK